MRLAELQKALRAVDPAAVLVAPSILERIIKQLCELPTLQWSVPHVKCYVVDRRMLFRHAEQADLDLEPDQLLPNTVILLARPSAEDLSGTETQALLLKYWRRLFHATIHHHFETPSVGQGDNGRAEALPADVPSDSFTTRPPGSTLTDEDIHRRVEEIGRTEFDEIRAVLVQDNYLPANAGEREIYIEFAAVYLELLYFAINLLPNYFPGLLGHEDKIKQLLARDVDAEAIFSRTRLAGAPDPVIAADTRSDASHEYYWKLLRAAERAAQVSNNVRAAILRTTASRVAPASLTRSTRDMAERDMASLAQRLQVALQMSETETEKWTEYLILLLDKADQGNQPVEARLLHDLQNVCIDHEREVYTLDLVEWVLSGGKKPIKRPLPSQRHVRIARHLRAANARLGAVRLADEDREQLGKLLAAALKKAEEGMRARFGPVLTTALHDVGLVPSNPPEEAAFKKMVEELLDRITSQGFLTFGDLRDTISRNQLKMPDLVEPQDFLRGDALLRLDRRLASLLDGVYRPGEFYMRWLERVTSLNFGTQVGRTITRWVTVPFGGALLLIKAGQVLVHMFQEEPRTTTEVGLGVAAAAAAGVAGVTPPAAPVSPLLSPADVLLYFLGVPALGFFLMALMHVPRFRAWWARLTRNVGRGLHRALVDFPARLLPWTTLTRVVQSWPFKVFSWYVLQPGLVCAALWFVLDDPFFHNHQNPSWVGPLALFLIVSLVFNSRLGQAAKDTLIQAFLLVWSLLRAGLITGLYRLIVQLSRQLLDGVEAWLFQVDEWLRFRGGDSKLSLVVRTILSVIWFPIAYLSRFSFIVFIEPALNPIKLAVASVAAKFIYPLIIALNTQDKLTTQLAPYLPWDWLAYALVVAFLWLSPDAFGFLFWEIKENWRLYRTNRQLTLGPVPLGPHGETMRSLLQPGFHSGTVPRLYARLRAAERDAYKTRNWHAVRKYGHELIEVQRCLREFVARELVAMVGLSHSWKGVEVKVGRIDLAINRVHFTLENAAQPAPPLELTIELRGRWLVAGISRSGWLSTLNAEQLRALTTALSSLYKMADIDVVREQVEALTRGATWELTREGLVVSRPEAAPLRYDLHRESAIFPRLHGVSVVGDGAPPGPFVEPNQMLFCRWRLTWERWVETWEKDQAGQGHPGLGGPVLLPLRLEDKSGIERPSEPRV